MNDGEPTSEALRTQLTELNIRSRWYSTQLWQLPFAYIGVTGVALATLAARTPVALKAPLIGAGLVGLLVLWHMLGVWDGQNRAVRNLQQVEEKLKLGRTAELKGRYYVSPLVLILVFVICSYFRWAWLMP